MGSTPPGETRLPLVVMVGPTAVGKTEISIEVAQAVKGEIVSADSRLLYRGMDVGTAKPSAAQRARVRHHMIDVADPEQPWSLARYRQAALQAIRDIQARRRLPFLVGGTGQYVTAVIEGWEPPPRPPDDGLRIALATYAAEHGAPALHRRLEAVDPARAAEIDPRNVRRVVRALEIYEHTGGRPSEMRGKQPPGFRILRIGLDLPREALYRRIDERVEAMLEGGWVREVQALLERGLSLDHPAMSAIGYRHIAAHLAGGLSLEQAVREIKRASRRFVRRQANWFKRDDPQIEWFEASEAVADRLVERVRGWLSAEGSGSCA